VARGKIGMLGSLMTVTTKAQAGHIGLEQIEAAREALKGQVVRTPTIAAPKLSELTGAEV
jgi:threonine dehydratase